MSQIPNEDISDIDPSIIAEQYQYYKFQVDFLMKEFMRKEEEIRHTNNELVEQRNAIFKQKKELEKQTAHLEKLVKDHDSGILYASYIQSIILGNQANISDFFDQMMIFYRPKDLVSGDFYWFHRIDDDKGLFAIGDCTGHGVPGALMTTLSISLLNEIIIKEGERNPNFILNHLDIRLSRAMKGGNEITLNDGLDITIIYYDKKLNLVSVSSTVQNMYHVSGGKLKVIKGVRVPLGDSLNVDKIFVETTFYVKEGDSLFMTTDGFKDQFGEDRRKFGQKRFEDMVLQMADLSMDKQKKVVNDTFLKWKGVQDQTDDILLAGIKV